MFDNQLARSTERGDGHSLSPTLQKNAIETFGEGQIDLKRMRGSRDFAGGFSPDQRRNGRSPSGGDDPRKSSQSQIFKAIGKNPDHDKILQYGAQLNDIALQLQEWVSIYQSQGSADGANNFFSINQTSRPLQQLKYNDGHIGIETAFGRTSNGNLRSSRSLGSSRRNSAKRNSRRKNFRSNSRSRSMSRSKSREGKKFIQRIENLRQNLEIEGKTIQTYYKKVEAEKQHKTSQSEKMTAS